MWNTIETFFHNHGPMLLRCVLVLVLGLLIIKLLMRIFKKSLEKSKIDKTMHRFILSLVKIVLWVLLAFTLLSNLNVDMTSLIAAFSVVGLAVSLAVQDILSHFIGGIILLITKPFEVGDYVNVDNFEGNIISINLFQTQINTADNKVIYIPNGQISTNKIINFSKEPERRLELMVSIAYEDSISKAKQILNDIIAANSMVLQDQPILVCVSGHGDSSVQLMIRVWVMNENFWDLKFALLEEIKEQFDKNDIHIPYSQLDVRIHS